MAIQRISVSNFKSFDEVTFEPGNLNIVIGANASGKSNLIQLFKFTKDLANFGLENAISMQGGVEYLRNIKIGASKNLSLEVIIDSGDTFASRKKEIGVTGFETTYKFALKFSKGGAGFEIAEDKLLQKCNFYRRKILKGEFVKGATLGQGEIIIYCDENKPRLIFKPPDGVSIDQNDIFQIYATSLEFQQRTRKVKTLLIDTPYLQFIGEAFRRNLKEMGTYDFDPRLPQKSQTITGRAELEQDGSNLAIILKNILRRRDSGRKLLNLLKEFLPFVSDLSVQEFVDKSLLFKLQETYFGKKFLPAPLVSDGTINIIALLIALYFEEKSVVVIEEPDRNIHPYLISKIMDILKEASRSKQIVLTTHNPEMVRNADLESILLISRDKDGFSTVHKPCEKDEVKAFLEDDMGIEELYVQNLLGM
jgi:predicted ATPase